MARLESRRVYFYVYNLPTIFHGAAPVPTMLMSLFVICLVALFLIYFRPYVQITFPGIISEDSTPFCSLYNLTIIRFL